MAPINPYIVLIRDRQLIAVGPFETEAAASAWARDEANNPADDPRWQVMNFTAPSLYVVTPDTATAEIAAGEIV